jgi:hypothetical protein
MSKFSLKFISGSNLFLDFETETVTVRAMSIQEELQACKRQLRSARENLLSANEKIRGRIYF